MPDEETTNTPEPEPALEPTPEPAAEPAPAPPAADPSELLAQIRADFEQKTEELTQKYEEALAERDRMIREILTSDGQSAEDEPEESEIQRRFIATHGVYKKW